MEVLYKRAQRRNSLILLNPANNQVKNMKNISKFFVMASIAVLVLGIGGPVLAQDSTASTPEQVSAQELGVSSPTMLPGDFFYFLKDWSRGLQSFFSFGNLKKAELQQQFANERLLELQKLVNKGTVSQDVLDRATEKYSQTMDKIKANTDRIKNTAENDKDVNSFLEKFANQQVLQERILQRLQNQASEDTAQKIEQARERHMERFGEVMQKLETNKEMIAERVQSALQNAGEENGEIMNRFRQNMPDDVKGEFNRVRNNMPNIETENTDGEDENEDDDSNDDTSDSEETPGNGSGSGQNNSAGKK